MNKNTPTNRTVELAEEREKIRRMVNQRGLGSLANDTKWDEFLLAMRSRESWRPSFRWKCIDGTPSPWDVEWHYHLPFPFVAVEWFDVYLPPDTPPRPSMPSAAEFSNWLERVLQDIGLDYRKGATMIRIFGYTPRNLDRFDTE